MTEVKTLQFKETEFVRITGADAVAIVKFLENSGIKLKHWNPGKYLKLSVEQEDGYITSLRK